MRKARRVGGLKTTPQERRKMFYARVENQSFEIKEAILEYRYMLDMNQKEFAIFTGLPLNTIQNFEQGKANPTLKTLEKMLLGSGLEICVRMKPPHG